ncbi:PREDICTED: TNF receptor-associated factor 2-like isoform X1 [Amphimedon queenslandica]|uniref:MATH domain-containing protein n=2 Tax=Amphimedon queenslandica TaxID=400682 RepID=A0AAN0IJF9_AMPQE|nr:PREDICTED: TNF receptor-associated factor 2-like isoform X1 [Amphimedon queenslandica]|eukprot:XP_003391412.2 PREDICTED: TNF receptor-associated factor 2-like isoform X1 [Amphimedon queenslandica]
MHRKQECPHCNEDFAMTEYQPHVDECPKMIVNCPLKDHGCKETNEMTREECINHLSSNDGLFDHVVMMVAALSSLPTNPLKSESLESFANLVRGSSGSVEDGVRGAIESFVTMVAELIAEITKKDSQICTLEDKVAQLETITMSFCYGNFDGSMVWKIPQFSQRMDDARTGKYTSIFSLPFYSSRYGYKMCLRLYILGDGIGKGTHMSLFFVVMKGEYDALLPWPFTHKVTFKLMNQCSKRDVVKAFQPDPLSSSFQKPKSDMNVASGCPRFVSKNELMEGGFIVDDTIFIKVKVDTAT